MREPGPSELDPSEPLADETAPYVDFCREAAKLGMDVNDYLEQNLEWTRVRPLVERAVLPYLRSDSTVCELGPGTGRWSREVLKALPEGRLELVDQSPWFVNFLTDYFQSDPRVHIHQNNGHTLPFPERSIDLVLSFGTFLGLKVGTVYRYAAQFHRVLRPGGHFVLEYLDPETPEGWKWLMEQFEGHDHPGSLTCYTPKIMAALFSEAGLEIVRDERVILWQPDYPFRFLTGRRVLL
jgi:ubiquinone/menaquinone biosynthesis C-methylase UbiE